MFRLFISSVRKRHQATGTSEKLELSTDGAKVSGPIGPANFDLLRLHVLRRA